MPEAPCSSNLASAEPNEKCGEEVGQQPDEDQHLQGSLTGHEGEVV